MSPMGHKLKSVHAAAREGKISAEQKARFKEKLISDHRDATGTGGGSSESNRQQHKSRPPRSGKGGGGGNGSSCGSGGGGQQQVQSDQGAASDGTALTGHRAIAAAPTKIIWTKGSAAAAAPVAEVFRQS